MECQTTGWAPVRSWPCVENMISFIFDAKVGYDIDGRWKGGKVDFKKE